MNPYWFKRKRYGWGLRPATWQGWTLLAVFVVFVVLDAMRLDAASRSTSDTLRPFIIQTAIMALVFIAIAYWKGEKPLGWRWGKENDGKKSGS